MPVFSFKSNGFFWKHNLKLIQEIETILKTKPNNQLKDKLKQHRQSSRGYLRTSLEKRLFNKLLQEKLNNNNYIM